MSYVDYPDDFIVADRYHNQYSDRHDHIMNPPAATIIYGSYSDIREACIEYYGHLLERAVQMYIEGTKVEEIMRRTGVRIACLYAVINKYYPSARRHRYRRLTNQEKKLIIEMYRSGNSIYKIAKELRRSHNTIKKVLREAGLYP